MFELILGITVGCLWVNSFLVANKRFALQPVQVRRPLRTDRYRTLRRLG